jgi:hypothetical protein
VILLMDGGKKLGISHMGGATERYKTWRGDR